MHVHVHVHVHNIISSCHRPVVGSTIESFIRGCFLGEIVKTAQQLLSIVCIYMYCITINCSIEIHCTLSESPYRACSVYYTS